MPREKQPLQRSTILKDTLPPVCKPSKFRPRRRLTRPALVAAAWVAWIAYAGLNVCLPNLMLKLSPEKSNTPYIATYFSVSGLMMAAGTILGGTLFDRFGDWRFVLPGNLVLDYYHYSFFFGWLTRTMGMLVLWLVVENGRRTG